MWLEENAPKNRNPHIFNLNFHLMLVDEDVAIYLFTYLLITPTIVVSENLRIFTVPSLKHSGDAGKYYYQIGN